jgi:structural maintenance of chromosome 4
MKELDPLTPFLESVQSFSSIVGPNGSGKSNVIDSMLFVFGVRAQKIRSKKVGVLIHQSDGHPKCDSCEVTVHFQEIIDQPDGTFQVVEGSEFSVTRVASSDNSSHYKLNGVRSNLKDVGQYLRQRKIDLDHNRFLILQGEVEQIAMMKPKAQNEHETGLLEFLEDVIGTCRYKDPLEKLGKKLDAIEEEREQKMNIVRLTEKELKTLDEPRKKALEFVRLLNDLTVMKNALYQFKLREYNRRMEVLTQEKDAINEESQSIKGEIAEMDKERKVHEDALKKVEE